MKKLLYLLVLSVSILILAHCSEEIVPLQPSQTDLFETEDSNLNRLYKTSADCQFLMKWGSNGSGDGQFNCPYGITMDGNGNIYVSDTENYRVQVFGAISKITVDIDIKPGSESNTINGKNLKQVITVAILTSDISVEII